MKDFNHCVVVGRLARDPERIGTKSRAHALFWIESQREWTDGQGQEHTDHFIISCRAFAHAANSILKHGRAGTGVICTGALQFEVWKDEHQQQQRAHVLVVTTLGFLSGSDLKGENLSAN